MHRVLVAWLAVAGCSKEAAASDDTEPPDTEVRTGCAAEPTPSACRACCLEADPVPPTEAVLIALLGGCACVQGGAPCREACGEEVEASCRGTDRSEACDACLRGVLQAATDQCLDVTLALCGDVSPHLCATTATCVDACE